MKVLCTRLPSPVAGVELDFSPWVTIDGKYTVLGVLAEFGRRVQLHLLTDDGRGFGWFDLSRVVSRALRHEPWLYELELDHQGWVPLVALVEALRLERSWSSLTVGDVEVMVAGASKQRHEIRDGRIRALYGHSLPGRVEQAPASPPAELFHGTSPAAAETILVEGLRPMGRQYVHLSIDRSSARAVGARKAPEPVILVVAARAAAEAGVAFYIGNDKVWLADEVPDRFVEVDR